MTTAGRPFRVALDEAVLSDLRDRLRRTRWPDAETVGDWSQGIPLATLRGLAEHWADGYDLRRIELRLNAHPQLLVDVDGLAIHALHVRSPVAGATPLVLTHGWPGSIVEFLDVVGPLSDPEAHGGSAQDAFHLVVPSLPGYGFSERPSEPGWGLERIADAWAALMTRLGYDRFGAQGGDWGAFVATHLARRHPARLVGIHVNLAIARTKALLALGEPTAEERAELDRMRRFAAEGRGYSAQQSTRPQTLGYALADSPVGQLAWIAEKLHAWTDGDDGTSIDRDLLLDDATLYWVTNTAASSARLYWESFRVRNDFEIPVPAGYSAYADLVRLSERWARTQFTDLRYYARPAGAGHFPALEDPAGFVDEVRRAFRTFR